MQQFVGRHRLSSSHRKGFLHCTVSASASGRARRSWSHILFVSLLALSLVVAGCSLGPGATAGSVAPNSPTVIITPPPQVTHRGRLIIQIAPDVTGSYAGSLRQTFLQLMAQWLDALPAVNSEQATIYVTAINAAPYAPSSTVAAFTIPGLPNWPTPPQLTPVPSCPENPYACSNAKATFTAANRTANSSYQVAIAKVQTQLQAIQKNTMQQTQQLLGWRPTIDLRATSIYGVLNLASQRFSTDSGDKWLILASDMQNNTNLDELPPDLTGVHVLVLFLQTPDAVARARTTATWAAVFKHAHAATIGFFDPAASAIMPSPWS